MTTKLPERAIVLLGEEEVGALVRSGERSRFEPAEDWASRPAGERAVLGLQFEEDPFAAHVGRLRLGVPLWFEHLLPEIKSPLRMAVARALNLAETRGYPLLLALGADLPGNVRVYPVEGDLSFKTVSRRIQEAHGSSDDQETLPLRVSLAGVQFKISARLGKRGIAVPGWDEEGDWILKFADQGHRELPAIEYATMEWAKCAGLNVPKVRLEATSAIAGIDHLRNVAGDLVFAIERYDRQAGGRVHQEDFAQVLGLKTGDGKYHTNVDTLLNVCATFAPRDVDEFIARLAFCVLSGNDDAHAKNFSLWYPKPAVPQLSPAYDLVATLAFPQYASNSMALKIAGTPHFESVTIRRFRTLGENTQLDPDKIEATVRAAVGRQVAAWSKVRDLPETPILLRDFIDRRLERLSIVEEVAV